MNFTQLSQPVNYEDHDVNRAFEVLKSSRPYRVQSLGGATIEFRQEVFVTDKLNFAFIKFCNEFIKNHPEIKKVADLGTGSGVIGVTLAKLNDNKHFAGFDISPKALELAEGNAKANNLNNIEFFKSRPRQWIPHEYETPVDLIISNPPFVGSEEWDDPKFLKEFPDCKYQPLKALKTKDQYGVSEYVNITKTALERKVKWVLFRLNGAYADKLFYSLQKYGLDIKLSQTPDCPVLIVKLSGK